MRRSFGLLKILLCVGLSCMSLFLAVGYAALSGTLTIKGQATYYEPKTIYITKVLQGGDKFQKYGYLTLLGNHTFNRRNETYTVTVEVKNNSGLAQYFDIVVIEANNPKYTASTVITSTNKPAQGVLLPHGATETYTITFKSTDRVSLNQAINNLRFTPDYGDLSVDAAKGVAEIFQNVLAGKGPDGNGGGITYQGRNIPADQIMSVLTENMESVDTGGYIGNVGNASQARKDLITAIFGENITFNLNGEEHIVSLLIKNQQIDNKGQADMVLYVTADPLNTGGGTWRNSSWQNLNYVPVYGLVFINNGAQGYEYCDHLFAGEAPVCDFGGKLGNNYTGNFNTNLWNSLDYPSLTDRSGGVITQDYCTTNGELDEAYQEFLKIQ